MLRRFSDGTVGCTLFVLQGPSELYRLRYGPVVMCEARRNESQRRSLALALSHFLHGHFIGHAFAQARVDWRHLDSKACREVHGVCSARRLVFCRCHHPWARSLFPFKRLLVVLRSTQLRVVAVLVAYTCPTARSRPVSVLWLLPRITALRIPRSRV